MWVLMRVPPHDAAQFPSFLIKSAACQGKLPALDTCPPTMVGTIVEFSPDWPHTDDIQQQLTNTTNNTKPPTVENLA